MEKIYRSLNTGINGLEANEESRKITGRAAVFDSWSKDIGGFVEIIRRGAITQELIDSSDVIANINHDDSQMIARSVNGKGTLELRLEDDGLYFSFDVPKTQRGEELLYNVRSGNLYECSFCFAIDKSNNKAQRWFKEDGIIKREINNIGMLFDISIVNRGAYSDTMVNARSIDKVDLDEAVKEIEKREIEEKQELIESLDLKLKEIEDICEDIEF